MPKEIERKFLVRHPEVVRGRLGARIVQGYLADEPMTVRVRVIEAEAFLTLKAKRVGIERDEFEFPLNITYANELLQRFCGARVIVKTRFRVPHAGRTFEVDVFEGRLAGLVTAEIELDAADEAVDLPAWIGDELTQDRRYSNSALSLAQEVPTGPAAE